MGKKKPFINKKTATTFSLVYREQDGLDGEDEGVERTLVPVGGPRGNDEHLGDGDYSIYESEYGAGG